MAPSATSLFDYLRIQSQVDLDAQSIDFAKKYGSFVDCTSNQADSYFEMLEPTRAQLIKESVERARAWKSDYPNATVEELAVEIAMTSISLTLAPLVSGAIHIMANPRHSWSTAKLLEDGQRISALCKRLSPDFPLSRLIVKVPATFEGLEACQKLKTVGIQTLATTVFTMAQCVLAAEAGCIYTAVFTHSLKSFFDGTCTASDSLAPLCAQAQEYYRRYNYPTRIKAAACSGLAELKQLVGVASITLPIERIEEAMNVPVSMTELDEVCLFTEEAGEKLKAEHMEKTHYLGDRLKWERMMKQEEMEYGTGEPILKEAIDIFSEYQVKAEELMTKTQLEL